MHRNFVQFVVAVGFFSVYCDGIHKGFGCAKVQFPYFALLQIPDPNGTLSCGATILSKKWLLTAAHCVRDAKNMTAYMGQKHYTEQSAESRFIKAKHIYTNSKYNATDQNNDIALLKLRKPIVFNDEIKPVMISNECHLGPDEIVFAVGYGAENYEGDISPKLQWAPLKLTSQKRCYDILDFLKPRQNYLCVGSNSNRSICSGNCCLKYSFGFIQFFMIYDIYL